MTLGTIFCSGRLVKIISPKTLHFNVLMRNGIKKSDYHLKKKKKIKCCMAIARRLMTAAVIYKKEMITKDNTCLVNWCDESRQFRV